jgi:hypothetical protein
MRSRDIIIDTGKLTKGPKEPGEPPFPNHPNQRRSVYKLGSAKLSGKDRALLDDTFIFQ